MGRRLMWCNADRHGEHSATGKPESSASKTGSGLKINFPDRNFRRF